MEFVHFSWTTCMKYWQILLVNKYFVQSFTLLTENTQFDLQCMTLKCQWERIKGSRKDNFTAKFIIWQRSSLLLRAIKFIWAEQGRGRKTDRVKLSFGLGNNPALCLLGNIQWRRFTKHWPAHFYLPLCQQIYPFSHIRFVGSGESAVTWRKTQCQGSEISFDRY